MPNYRPQRRINNPATQFYTVTWTTTSGCRAIFTVCPEFIAFLRLTNLFKLHNKSNLYKFVPPQFCVTDTLQNVSFIKT